jgi:uncharacterized repeat protein (TIGR01451 family)
MHSTMKRCFTVVLIALASLAPLAAWAQSDVTVNLTAQRVIPSTSGKEAFAPGDQARPGDVLEYRATYHNTTTSRVRQLAATLPVPHGMVFVPGTASPGVFASLDGKTFEPYPLKRRVKLDDGRVVVREVPASEVRWLRWSLGALDAKADKVVRARLRVEPVAVAALVQR